MVLFFPSIQPSLLSSCRNPSTWTALPPVLRSKSPMRKIFPVCCASASETFARKRVASSQTVILFFMFFSCLVPHTVCLFSFDQPIRSGEHLRRNLNADLFRCPKVNNKLKLRGLLYRQVAWFCAFENFIYIMSSLAE